MAEKDLFDSLSYHRTILIAFPILLALAFGGGYLITGRFLKPIRDIRRTAEEIRSGGDLSKRIGTSGSGDELDELSNTMNAMFDKLEKDFKAQKQFTSNASHELRTPVSVILAQCEYGFDHSDSAEELIKYCSKEKPNVEITLDDNAAIYYSSGTTGFPKAILHAHRSLEHAALTEQNHHGQTHDDVFLCIPPLYHTGAKMHWFGSLVVGGKAVLLKGIRPEWILRAVSSERCTIVWLLVPWAQDILDAIDRGDIDLSDHILDQWRLMHIGAQPVPHSLIERWMQRFPNHQYDTNYGLSESIGPGCIHLGVENIDHVGAIGVPGYGWEAKICDGDGNEMGPNEVGEIRVKGPGVMKCYYRDKAATAESLKDGWLCTGDMAYKDPDGFIYIVDRKKDVIITGGENLYPVQIEDFLRKHDAIKDVAVIGLPDERLGEIATAIISVKEDCHLSEQEVNDFCKGLPRYKRPRKIIFAEVPRNPTGKIEKPKLRELYAGANLVEQQTKK